KPKMRGTPTFKDVEILVRLRNALTHFKPEWDDEEKAHKGLSDVLKSKISGSPFLNDPLLFPRRWACRDCTEWAVRTSMAFAQAFEQLANLPAKYKSAELEA